jgi:hypothetical protein
MAQTPAILCQSPYHWTAAYSLAAMLLVGLSLFGDSSNRLLGADHH